MLGLRAKLLAGLGSLMAILLAVALLSNSIVAHYSDSIQTLFYQDYDSAAACQVMQESVDAVAEQAERRVWGDAHITLASAQPAIDQFESEFAIQSKIADVPGEREATDRLKSVWNGFIESHKSLFDPALTETQRRDLLTSQVLPRASEVRSAAQEIIDMNIRYMTSGRGEAKLKAVHARWAMHLLTASGLGVAAVIVILCGTIVLRPLRLLTRSVNEISTGKLDLAVNISGHDEIAQLAGAFNQMAAQLREFKRLDHEKLVRTQHTTQLAIDSLPDAVIVLDRGGTIELVNQTAIRLFDLMPGMPIAGCNLRALSALAPATPQPHQGDAPGYRAAIRVEDDGRTRYFLPRTYPILDEHRSAIGTAVVLVDVTDFRRLDEMKNDLLATVAHELKTPLTTMRMIMHLLSEARVGPLGERQRELLAAARDESERLQQIVENLMDMGRIESGKALMDVRPVRADELVRRCVEPLKSSFDAHGIELAVRLPEAAPRVNADESRMLHVFGNLLGNALKYTPAGGTVTVSLSNDEHEARFSVADNGPGIAPEFLPRIFEKFFRAPGQQGNTGSGLGLAIVKDVIEAHGGRIWVESREGRGTAFHFALPAVAESPAEEAHVLAAAT